MSKKNKVCISWSSGGNTGTLFFSLIFFDDNVVIIVSIVIVAVKKVRISLKNKILSLSKSLMILMQNNKKYILLGQSFVYSE